VTCPTYAPLALPVPLVEDVEADDFVVENGGHQLVLYIDSVIVDAPRPVVVARLDRSDVVDVDRRTELETARTAPTRTGPHCGVGGSRRQRMLDSRRVSCASTFAFLVGFSGVRSVMRTIAGLFEATRLPGADRYEVQTRCGPVQAARGSLRRPVRSVKRGRRYFSAMTTPMSVSRQGLAHITAIRTYEGAIRRVMGDTAPLPD
jgi:hypothetical protein